MQQKVHHIEVKNRINTKDYGVLGINYIVNHIISI